jgi:hypothetical protein
VHLSIDDVEALNRMGVWLAPEATGAQPAGERLGDALRKAVHLGHEDQTFAGVTIGSSGWYSALEPKLAELEEAGRVLDRLRRGAELAGGNPIGSARRYELLQRLRRSEEKVAEVDDRLQNSFLWHIGLVDAADDDDGKLANAALNELMALCTAAAWAYEDIRLRSRAADVRDSADAVPEESFQPQLHLTTGQNEARADLRLNTAELNLFTIASFLLCAPRVRSNPLRLLVLDDPLQNMDGLMSLTLARGLQRLLRLWRPRQRENWRGLPGWRLLLMLHGEDDMQRFRSLLPCDTHQLEWLRTGVEITRQSSVTVDAYQPLSPELIHARRESDASSAAVADQ